MSIKIGWLSGCYYVWRRGITILCFASYAILGLCLAVIALPVAYGNLPVSPSIQRLVRYGIHLLCRFLLWFLRVTGCARLCIRPNRAWALEKKANGQVCCANHPTYLDVVVLLSLVPDALCVVKSAALKWPWSRSFVRLAGYISNAQPDLALQICITRLAEGETIILFPEGTRSPLHALNKFQRGLANLLLRTEACLTPILLACQPMTLGKQQAWHQVPDHPYTLYVNALPPMGSEGWLGELRRNKRPIQLRVRELNRSLENYFDEKLSEYGYLRNPN